MSFLGRLRIRDRFLVQYNVHSKVKNVFHLQFVHLGRFYKVFPRDFPQYIYPFLSVMVIYRIGIGRAMSVLFCLDLKVHIYQNCNCP